MCLALSLKKQKIKKRYVSAFFRADFKVLIYEKSRLAESMTSHFTKFFVLTPGKSERAPSTQEKDLPSGREILSGWRQSGRDEA